MTKIRCVLAQTRINKVHEVLAQITRDNFFYERTRTKTWLGEDTNHNKKRTRCVNTKALTRVHVYLNHHLQATDPHVKIGEISCDKNQ